MKLSVFYRLLVPVISVLFPLVSRAELKTTVLSPPSTLVDSRQEAYFYAPALIEEGATTHVFDCSSGGPISWDYIRYRTVASGANTPGAERLMLTAAGADSSDRSTCDPSLVKFGGYYYLYYTGNEKESYCNDAATINAYKAAGRSMNYCGQSSIFVARAISINGPYQKHMGAGRWEAWREWDTTAAKNPTAIIRRLKFGSAPMNRLNSFGAGQPAVVNSNNRIYLWFYDDSETLVNEGNTYRMESVDGISWTNKIKTNVTGAVSADVKLDTTANKFLMFSFETMVNGVRTKTGHHEATPSIVVRKSADGVTWDAPETLFAYTSRIAYASNLGVSSNNLGWISLADIRISYGAIPTLSCPVLKDGKPQPGTTDPTCWARWNLDSLRLRFSY